MTVLGQVIVIINSHTAMKELVLGTRTSVFSGRPTMKFIEMYNSFGDQYRFLLMYLVHRTGISESLPVRPYDKGWRDRRRVVDNHFRATTLQRYRHVQKQQLAVAMKSFVRDPVRYVTHIRQYVFDFLGSYFLR
jgi:hypothetical protein